MSPLGWLQQGDMFAEHANARYNDRYAVYGLVGRYHMYAHMLLSEFGQPGGSKDALAYPP